MERKYFLTKTLICNESIAGYRIAFAECTYYNAAGIITSCICVRDRNGKPGEDLCDGLVPDLQWIARPLRSLGHAIEMLMTNPTILNTKLFLPRLCAAGKINEIFKREFFL